MKLECACGETYLYDHQRAGQPFQCSYCKQSLTMPTFESLRVEDQEEYRREWEKKRAKLLKEKQRIEENRRRIEESHKREEERRAAVEQVQQERASHGPPELPHLDMSSPSRRRRRLTDLLDLRFQRYLTPWIIRMTWLWALLLGCLGFMGYSLLRLPAALPQEETIPLDVPYAIRMAQMQIVQLIAQKEAEQRFRERRQTDSREPVAPDVSREEPEPEPDRREERQGPNYEDMTLEQLRAELARLQQQYPESETRLNWSGVLFYAMVTAGR